MSDIHQLLASRGPGALAERMGIVLHEVSVERVIASMPVAGNTQPYGLLHGGASAVLAETAGSLHAAVHAGAGNQAVGLDISCTHHRSATSGMVTATSTPLSLGKTIASLSISIVDDEDRLVCSARLTCLIRQARTNTQGS